jgi:hypothetical protein
MDIEEEFENNQIPDDLFNKLHDSLKEIKKATDDLVHDITTLTQDESLVELAKTKRFYIPMFSGRPNRNTVISQDDITNLIIDLERNQI